jgi:transposase-like protein
MNWSHYKASRRLTARADNRKLKARVKALWQDGLGINRIAARLNVSYSAVSNWTRVFRQEALREAKNYDEWIANGGLAKDYIPKQPTEPTLSYPGSSERIEVYRQREERGESIFHWKDL